MLIINVCHLRGADSTITPPPPPKPAISFNERFTAARDTSEDAMRKKSSHIFLFAESWGSYRRTARRAPGVCFLSCYTVSALYVDCVTTDSRGRLCGKRHHDSVDEHWLVVLGVDGCGRISFNAINTPSNPMGMLLCLLWYGVLTHKNSLQY